MSEIVIWHNPRCSKSRQTLQLLQSRGVEPEIVEYLKYPPTKEEIKNALSMLDMKPRDLMRTGEAIYKETDLKNESDEDALISAMADYPILIERPIVFSNEKAAIGRPPESVLQII